MFLHILFIIMASPKISLSLSLAEFLECQLPVSPLALVTERFQSNLNVILWERKKNSLIRKYNSLKWIWQWIAKC